MEITRDKLLVMAGRQTTASVLTIADQIPGLTIFEADSDNSAFALIYDNDFALVIVDETLDHIDIYKIGSMLLSHRESYDTPLLIITDKIRGDRFMGDFSTLRLDYLLKPFTEKQLLAKITIFYDLFRQKNAVVQGVKELEQAYQKIAGLNEQSLLQNNLHKNRTDNSRMAATSLLQALSGLRSNIHHLVNRKEIRPATKSSLTTIKTSVEQIAQVSKRLLSPQTFSQEHTPPEEHRAKAYSILYAQGSDEEFDIFRHCLKNILRHTLTRAGTMDNALSLIAEQKFDLIFTDHLLDGFTGFDLLSRLKQMRVNAPVVFAFSRSHASLKSRAISKGALNFIVKEELTSANLAAVISRTIGKADISREVDDAINRVVMIAQKDHLTRLYTPEHFERALSNEISKARRYKTELSMLIIRFEAPAEFDSAKVHEAERSFLAGSAAVIRSIIRESDIAGRITKDCFSLLLPHTGLDGAKILAKRIRKKIEHHKSVLPSPSFSPRTTFGAAAFDQNKSTSGDALTREAMDAAASGYPTT